MKHIVEAFSILVALALNLCLCIGMLTASAEVAAAKEFKADVVAEIENSDFNPLVIEGCREQASRRGYTLEVDLCGYGGNQARRIADVRLKYVCKIPILGISKEQVTWGIAR